MTTCRLCGGFAHEKFRATVLRKYEIAYHQCEQCGSLETDVPYWLGEAYAVGNLVEADTGAVARNLNCQAVVWAALRVLRISKRARVLDFGGGNGLLCRLLRDRGFDARVSDENAVNDFALGFEDDGGTYDVICAFEVAEHFAEPGRELAQLVDRANQLCLVGTETYQDQGREWWYLSATGGQHVFFYSARGMKQLAEHRGAHYLRVGNVHLFRKRDFSKLEAAFLRRILSDRGLQWVRAYLAYSQTFAFAMSDTEQVSLRS